MNDAIKVQNVQKIYATFIGKKKRVAVDTVSFSVPEGHIFGLLGPNGAGKTTIIKMLCGLVLPTSGSLFVQGYDVTRQRNAVLARIGAVLEGSRNVHWRLSPMENLRYFAELRNVPAEIAKTRAKKLLEQFDLTERRNAFVGELSRGMQQKVAVAVALMSDPPVLFLDEPTIGLDVQTAQQITEHLKKVAQEEKKTILLTTHQMHTAEELCGTFGIINKGKIIASGPLDEIRRASGECPGHKQSLENMFLRIIRQNNGKEDHEIP